MDETLVHTTFDYPGEYDHVLNIEGTTIYIHIRPGLDRFLNLMAQYWIIVIWTASIRQYADPIINALDRDCIVQFRKYRDHCVFKDGHYTKNLVSLKVDLKDILIVDVRDSIHHVELAKVF